MDVFDAIVVGAGPAGSACAYRLAREGLETLLVERGKFAGAKNMWGGAFYGPVLHDLFEKFEEEAPVERFIRHRKISLLNREDCLTVEFTPGAGRDALRGGFTLLRSRFDRWMAKKAEEAGAVLACGLGADDLLVDGGRVTGIRAGGDEMPARVVVACDGVNSLLARKAGLRPELAPEDVKLGVKEVIELGKDEIDVRFGLRGDAGAAWEFIGSTRGLPGGSFIYTNRETLSVGVVVKPTALGKAGVKADELLEEFKQHPAVAGCLEGGRLVEYSAHLIPAAGRCMMPKLERDGFLVAGDAAALVLSTGLVLEGANFAVASGLAAAETVLEAKKRDDFSSASLSAYRQKLESGFVLKDLQTFERSAGFLENPRIYSAYPEILCDAAAKILGGSGKPRDRSWKILKSSMKGRGVSLWRLLRDLMGGKGAL
jgi:electron transfer flavoprotein-quinone oxidoreductase